jgi:hypothetical protein
MAAGARSLSSQDVFGDRDLGNDPLTGRFL